MDEDYRRAVASGDSGLDQVTGDLLAIASHDLNQRRLDPFAGEEFRRRRGGDLHESGTGLLLANVDFVGPGGKAVDVRDAGFVRGERDVVFAKPGLFAVAPGLVACELERR